MSILLYTASLIIMITGMTECQYRESVAWQPYSFGYSINDGYGNEQTREEKSDTNGHKRGSYGYVDAYGIYRKVDYIADEHGFRASISTNEPGTGGGDPADVHMEARPVANPVVVAAAPAYHAPPSYHIPPSPPTYHSPVHIEEDSAPIYSEASHQYPHDVPYGHRRVALAPTVAYSEPRAYRRLPAPTPYLPLRHASK